MVRRNALACLVVWGLLLARCSADDTVDALCTHGACGTMDGGTDFTDGGYVPPGYDVPSLRTLRGVQVTPEAVSINVVVGVPMTVPLRATGTLSDGTVVPLTGTWSVPDPGAGAVDPVSGVYTANGLRGGAARVDFATPLYGGGTASAVITVRLFADVTPAAGTPGADGATRFGAAVRAPTDPSASPHVLYPLDGVLFPQNLTAPTVQWEGGVAGDLYRVVYTRPHVTITQYVAHTGAGFTFSGALPDTVWSRLAETDPGLPAQLVVDRLDAVHGLIYPGNTVTMRFAQGSVSGAVYYWSMAQGQLHRVPAGTTMNEALFPSGIRGTADTASSYTYTGCIACHQISRDGRYLLANGTEAYVFDLRASDPTMAMTPVRVRPGFRWYFATMSPDDRRVFATMADTHSAYVDPVTMNAVTPGGVAPPATGVAHPNWSPDGNTIALISNVTGWSTNASFTGGDLTLLPVTAADTFGAAQVIHRGADLAHTDPAGGNTDAFPSWTPDSRYVVFAHTSNTRAAAADGRAPGSLYIIPPRAGATPVRLAHASDEASIARAHYPNLSPFVSGGYYWIVFYSDRDYGNAQVGSRGAHRPQLWVSAIDQTFDGAADPSQVPYWLPGQDVAQQNADAVWAAAACRMTGDTCRTVTDCCGGGCSPGTDGMFRCMTAAMCRREGESCEHDSDCCGGGMLVCEPRIHTCQRPIG